MRQQHPEPRQGLRLATLLGVGTLIGAAATWSLQVAWLTRQNDRACNPAPHRDSLRPAEPAPRLQHVLADTSARYRGIGLQATVIFGQRSTWTGAAGYASLKRLCPETPDHLMGIGSMTKLFTATLVMQQVEQRAISLDDPVSRWVDAPAAGTVNVRQLLNHTSGVPEYAWDPWLIARWLGLPAKIWRPEELLAVIRHRPLRFPPGARHEYSNSNYLLLGIVLQQVTGRPYEVLLREQLLGPLGLTGTYFGDGPCNLPIANAYDEALIRLGRRNVTGFRRSLLSGGYAAGGMLSTSEDVACFLHALMSGTVLSPGALREMQSWVPTPDPDLPCQQGYGLGLRKLLIGEETWVGHTGSMPGYSGIAVHNRAREVTIAVLSNLSRIDQVSLLEALQDALPGP
jgi:D-alanyl-D-alanine carboxypeptidase